MEKGAGYANNQIFQSCSRSRRKKGVHLWWFGRQGEVENFEQNIDFDVKPDAYLQCLLLSL